MERKRTGRLLAAFVVALVATLGLVLGMGTRAYAKLDPVKYLDAKGEEKTCDEYTTITSETTGELAGWCVVDGKVTVDRKLTPVEDAHIILCDGAELNVKGLEAYRGVGDFTRLTIYAQSTGNSMGKLVSKQADEDASGIGADGALTINGGVIEAEGGDGGLYSNAEVIINGGKVTCSGEYGIVSTGSVEINGGNVTCSGDFGIVGYSVKINGGTVTMAGNRACIAAIGGEDSLTIAKGISVIEGNDEASARPVADPSKWEPSMKWARTMPSVPVESVELSPATATLEVGKTAALKATVKPDDATDKTVKWTVGGTDSSAVTLYSDETCKTPVETGKATETLTVYAKGMSAGKATVTCTSYADADKSASCDVTVEAATVPVETVELSPATATIEAGKTLALKATVKPDDATDKTVTWESSDGKVATVGKDGVVTAVAAGKATVTAKAGDKAAACEVTVTQPVTGVELDKKSATIEAGKTEKLTATVKPDDATDKTVTWESSDGKVATVKDGTVTAVATGKATITARAGDKAATCEVTVTATPEPGPGPEPAGAEMFRLYNPYTGEHFYTASAEERDFNVGLGWQDEGVGWVAPEEGEPVFRVYNPYAGDHHYTTSEVERDHLVSVGWNDEGVGWYSAGEDGVPLWRQYNPNAIAGAHNYTTSEAERDHLVEIGWSDEGIGWYGLE